MSSNTTKDHANPREKANIISILFFWWTKDLFKKCYKKDLQVEELFDPLTSDRASYLGDELEKQWNRQLSQAQKFKCEPSFFKAILSAFYYDLFFEMLHHAICDVVVPITQAFLLGMLLSYFRGQTTVTYEDALGLAAGLSIAEFFKAILGSHKFYNHLHFGGRIRIAICSLIYRKALRLSKSSMGDMPPGKIVNLIATDINKIEIFALYINDIWCTPLNAITVGIILYFKGGIPALIGFAGLLIASFVQVFCSFVSGNYNQRASLKTDARIRLLDEILSGIQVIKMYAWEKPYRTLMSKIRESEFQLIRKNAFFRDMALSVYMLILRIAIFSTMVSMFESGETLTSAKVFSLIPFFAILADSSTLGSKGVGLLVECRISVQRLQSFLLLEEFSSADLKDNKPRKSILQESLKQNEIEYIKSPDSESRLDSNKIIFDNSTEDTYAIVINNLITKWNLNSSNNSIEIVNLKLEKGKLYMVIGMIGSGKSTFLSSILREINVISGDVLIKGTLSYAGQEPWLFGSSVKQNILFGKDFDHQRYSLVTHMCSLRADFKQFPQGDNTIVGERGVSLSGGQKARINLARSVYRDADIYLFDDPLSAVDAHVGKHLFEECILGYLKGKTRILATHQLQYIKHVDGIIHFHQGKALYYDNYHQLLRYHPEYMKLIAMKDQENTIRDDDIEEINNYKNLQENGLNGKEAKGLSNKKNTIEKSLNDRNDNLLFKYLQFGSNLFWLCILGMLFVLTQIAASACDAFVYIFIMAEEENAKQVEETKSYFNYDVINNENGTNYDIVYPELSNNESYVYIYVGLIVSVVVIGFIKTLVFGRLSIRSSDRLHNKSFDALIGTNLRFFHTNQSGRIFNRLTKDIIVTDDLLPKTINDLTQMFFTFLGGIAISCWMNPFMVVPAVILILIYYFSRKAFVLANNSIKRLEGLTRAPVFTQLIETLNGISIIRVCQAEHILKEEFDQMQDVYTAAWYYSLSCRFTYGFFLRFTSFIFTAILSYSFVIFREHFTGGNVGLALTQIFTVTAISAYLLTQSAEAETNIMAVERLLEYTRLPPECEKENTTAGKHGNKSLSKDYIVPPVDWPSEGCVLFKDVYLRYSHEDAPVLKKLNFLIKPREKVGIVGRTGAGKSSLINALFRLSIIEGTIEIDGINTGSLLLETLRSRLSIIPQDPVLFSGTLRQNLDPFYEFTDDAIWNALEQVELKNDIMSTTGLNYHVVDKGGNFSVGQKQLICLARAILRKNKILIMDEATANVDPQTDFLIQQKIHTKFDECTVLTIAHRLNTIIQSDKIIVMDKGNIVEFDHPYTLLRNEFGYFHALVKETGPEMFQTLNKLAEEYYITKTIHIEEDVERTYF